MLAMLAIDGCTGGSNEAPTAKADANHLDDAFVGDAAAAMMPVDATVTDASAGDGDAPLSDVADALAVDASLPDRVTDAGGDDATTVDAAQLDGAACGVFLPDTAVPDATGEDASGFAVAEHPPMPQVESCGGQVLAAPVFTSVTFPGYDQTALVDGFIASVGATSYWHATTSEYGVGVPVSTAPVHVMEGAPSTVDDSTIQAWLAGKLDGTHPEFGTPTANSVYVLFYPSQTVVTSLWPAYHLALQLVTGRWAGLTVPYAVISEAPHEDPRALTEATSHELIEACTDPFFSGFCAVDSRYQVWAVLGESELGDMCMFLDSQPPGYSFWVQRTWSNVSAASSHDPCQPSLPGAVYFNAAPVLPDCVGAGTAPGVLLQAHQSKTIEVDLYSDDAMPAWNVSATDFNGGQWLRFSFDTTTGQNGDKLHLTITAYTQNSVPFALVSQSGGLQHSWYGTVSPN